MIFVVAENEYQSMHQTVDNNTPPHTVVQTQTETKYSRRTFLLMKDVVVDINI